jgi:hypothetical protein
MGRDSWWSRMLFLFRLSLLVCLCLRFIPHISWRRKHHWNFQIQSFWTVVVIYMLVLLTVEIDHISTGFHYSLCTDTCLSSLQLPCIITWPSVSSFYSWETSFIRCTLYNINHVWIKRVSDWRFLQLSASKWCSFSWFFKQTLCSIMLPCYTLAMHIWPNLRLSL